MIDIIEATVCSCIHLLILKRHDRTLAGIGSAAIIRYKGRFFLCTVQHNIRNPANMACIATGLASGENSETIEVGDFSYVDSYTLPEGNSEALYLMLNDSTPGKTLDIAFREIPEMKNIIQQHRVVEVDGKSFNIPLGGKAFLVVDDDFEPDMDSVYSFYGRVRPAVIDGKMLHFEENLITGIKLVEVREFFLKFDLGRPIKDHSNFKGCSGAPILDFDGRLVGFVSGGSDDVNDPYVCGFRLDKLKLFIQLSYFRDLPEPQKNN